MASMTADEEMLLAILDSDDDSDIEEFIIISALQRQAEKKELEDLRRERHGTRLNLRGLRTTNASLCFALKKLIFRVFAQHLVYLRTLWPPTEHAVVA